MISFTPFPILSTERLILRQIETQDMNEFFILKSDERLLKNYDAKARTFDEACRKLHELDDDISNNISITWGIALKRVNKIIGSICYWNFSDDQLKAEIGYELMHDYQGMGIMQEAIKAVIEYGFGSMKLQTIEAVPNPNNLRSIRLLEKNNFLKESDFSEIDPFNGKALPRVLYTRTADKAYIDHTASKQVRSQ